MNLPKWQIYLIIVALLIILTPIGIYVGHFYLNPVSSNPQEWGPFGDFIGGIMNPVISLLTLAVTIIIAFVLKRIDDRNRHEDRAASYQPQLVAEQATFYTYVGSKFAGKKPVEFSIIPKGFTYISDFQLPNIIGIDIYNIGLGPAKNVELEYEIDVPTIIEWIPQISNFLPQPERIVVTHEQMPIASMLRFQYPAAWNIGPFRLPQIIAQKTRITHILNANVSSKPFTFKLPQFFLELYSVFQYVWNEQMQVNANLLPNFPPIYLTAKYRDIGRKLFSQKFQIQLASLRGGTEFVNEISVQEIQS